MASPSPPPPPTMERLSHCLSSGMSTIHAYEDASLQKYARSVIPFSVLRSQHRNKYSSPSDDVAGLVGDDLFLMHLLRWFKCDFFTWVNKPPCVYCGTRGLEYVSTDGPQTPDELSGLASRVEIYRCKTCGPDLPTRFPRYNSALRLLQPDARKGRCGEWSNAFCAVARAAGFETRYVHDLSDHVWAEVWSSRRDRWLHADPCEMKLDEPGVYEHGWNKSLSYVFAFGKDEGPVDVTGRYSRKTATEEFKSRRGGVTEEWLQQNLASRGAEARRAAGVDAARAAELDRRAKKERDAMRSAQGRGWEATKGSSEGRISGDNTWKTARGEAGGDKGPDGTAAAPAGVTTEKKDAKLCGNDGVKVVPAFLPIEIRRGTHSRVTVDPNLHGRPALPHYRAMPSLNRGAIVVNETPCALGSSGLNVVVVDEASSAILQSCCFNVSESPNLSGLDAFLASIPRRRILCAATVNLNALPPPSVLDCLLRRLSVSFQEDVSAGFAFVTSQHYGGNKPSFHTVSTGRIDVVFPPLSAEGGGGVELAVRAFANVAPSLVAARVPDDIMHVDKQMNCTPEEAAQAGTKALESNPYYVGFAHFPKQPIFLLSNSAFPLKNVPGWVTNVKLPRPLVPEMKESGALSISNTALFVNLLGPSLCSSGGAGIVPTSKALREKRLIAFYFSASWCGPCKGFTPILSSFYQRHQTLSASDLEIIFVSSDRSEADFNAYRREMPWLSLPFAERAKQQVLSQTYGVRGIPCLVVVDSVSGFVISKNGREDVTRCGPGPTDASVAIWLSILPETSLDAFDLAQVANIEAREQQQRLMERSAESYLVVTPSVAKEEDPPKMTDEELKTALKARVKALFSRFVKEDGLDPNAAAARAIKEASETPITPPPPAPASHEQDALPCRRFLCIDAIPRERGGAPPPPFQYFRLTIMALRHGANDSETFFQLGAVRFYGAGGCGPALVMKCVANPEGASPANELPMNLMNNDVSSKFLDFNFPKYKKTVLIFEMTRPEVVGSYEFWTANDCEERDPSAWILEGAASVVGGEGIGWTKIDEKEGFECPGNRLSETGRFVVDFGGTKEEDGAAASVVVPVIDIAEATQLTTFDDSVRLLSSSRSVPPVRRLSIGTDMGIVRKIVVNGGEATHGGDGFDNAKLDSFELGGGEFIVEVAGIFMAPSNRIMKLEFTTSTGRTFATAGSGLEGGGSLRKKDKLFSLVVPNGFAFVGFKGTMAVADSTIISLGIVCVDCRLTTKEAPCPPTCSRRFLTSTPAATRRSVLGLALKFVENAIKSPSTPKLRSVKLSNRTFDKGITQVPGSVEFLVEMLGFDSFFSEGIGETLLTLPLLLDLEETKKMIEKEISRDDWQNEF